MTKNKIMIHLVVFSIMLVSIFSCVNKAKSNTKKNNLNVNKNANTEKLKDLQLTSPYIEIINEYLT